MRSFAELEAVLDKPGPTGDPVASAKAMLAVGEEVLEHWITARDDEPTQDEREGFRLLGLHRQGARGEPSFNACRETCRELVYHYNLITMQPAAAETTNRVAMMQLVSRHLLLFVSGKMQVAELGEFCCSSKPIRHASGTDNQLT